MLFCSRRACNTAGPLALLLCLLNFGAIAQNLVPNPSFEQVGDSICAVGGPAYYLEQMQIWYSPNWGTPDAFSTAVDSSCWNHMPYSSYSGLVGSKGPQLPRTGEAFSGIFLYSFAGRDYREYLQAPLLQTLDPCRAYEFSMYVSLSDSQEFASPNIDVAFSTGPITQNNTLVLNIPHMDIRLDSAIMDYTGWTRISVVFHPSQAYTYLTIGNFNDDNNTILVPNPQLSWSLGRVGSYYLIDDVSLLQVEDSLELVGPQKICLGEPVQLYASTIPACYDSIRWNTGATSPNIWVTEGGLYRLTVWQDGEPRTAETFVEARPCPGEAEFPNVFSPNGDGIHDVFEPMQLAHVRSGNLSVYDRWGTLLYSTDNLLQAWDGTVGGKACPEGVYFYVVRYRGSDLSQEQRAGQVTLLR